MSTELKTVAQALYEVLSREEFEKVVVNSDPDFCDVDLEDESENAPEDLQNAFWWRKSPEGFQYWYSIYERIGGED